MKDKKPVTRYDTVLCNCVLGPHVETETSKNGEWVKSEDYDALADRFDEAVDLIRDLREALDGLASTANCSVYDEYIRKADAFLKGDK